MTQAASTVDGITFVVPGTPVGKGRPRAARRGAHVVMYTPPATASYENLVKLKAEAAMQGRAIIAGAVEVALYLYVTPPASWSAKKKAAALDGWLYPTTKPDIDNVTKGFFDACNGIVWGDDKQVVDALVRKRYSDTAKVVVKIKEISN